MRMDMVIRSTLTVILGLALTGTAALAQSDKELSDAERAKRDAAKVFSFIKFQTVRSAAPKPAAAPVAATPVAAPTKVAEAKPAEPEAEAPRLARMGADAAGAATELRSDDVQIAVPALQPAAGQALTALPTEIVPEEVELELVHYVPPDMNRQVLDAMTKPEYLVPVRFVVTEDGRVATAQPAANVPRRIGQAAAKAVQQWRFKPLPAAREVDVEIAFKAD